VADYTPALKRALRAAGCTYERAGKGDHEIWFSPHTARRFPVDAAIKSRHLLPCAKLPSAGGGPYAVAFGDGAVHFRCDRSTHGPRAALVRAAHQATQ